MTTNVKKAVILTGTIAMVGAGIVPGVQAFGVDATPEAPATEIAITNAIADGNDVDAVKPVTGVFSFDQNRVSGNDEISNVFTKAVAAMCASMPEDGAMALSHLTVNVMGDQYAVALSDAEGDEAASQIIGCACSSNIAGGGAIVNAAVGGVSLETIAQVAGVSA